LLSQVPQLLRSTFKSTHPLAQADVGAGQPHCPLTQPVPPEHVTLHAPQLFGSF
jgi:hypothetical protein